MFHEHYSLYAPEGGEKGGSGRCMLKVTKLTISTAAGELLQELGAPGGGDGDLIGAADLRGEAQLHPEEFHFSRGPRGLLGLQLKAEEPHETVEGAEPGPCTGCGVEHPEVIHVVHDQESAEVDPDVRERFAEALVAVYCPDSPERHGRVLGNAQLWGSSIGRGLEDGDVHGGQVFRAYGYLPVGSFVVGFPDLNWVLQCCLERAGSHQCIIQSLEGQAVCWSRAAFTHDAV